MKRKVSYFMSLALCACFMVALATACHREETNEEEQQTTNEALFPAVVEMNQESFTVEKCDTETGQYRLKFNESVPSIKKGSVVIVENNVVLVTDAKTSDKTVDIKGRLGDLTYVFRNVTLTLTTNEESTETKALSGGKVYYPQMILNGADTLYRSGETKGEHTFFGDDFKIWDKTYSETATIYKSSIASITATPTLSSKLNVAFVLEFLDETQSLIDDVAFLKAKQFNFSGVLYGDLTTALNLKADISKSGTYEGEPTRIVKNLMPRMTLRFQIGLIPFWITMGCDLFAKTKMDYSGELHFEQNLSATYLFEEGVKYMPYSAYQIADKWNRFETSTDFPAPVVSGKASWTGQIWVYPRFYAEVDYILGPSFEIKPYLKANIAAGFKEGEVDITKNYLANTASAQVGIDAAVGVSSFLEDVGVNPDKGMYNLGTIKEWEIFRSPSSIELLSSSVDKVRKGQELKLKYQVYQKNFGDEIPSPFFPIVKVEIPKTGEYYYRFSGTSGQVEFTRIPKSSDEIYYAKVFNADGGVVDEVQFGDGSLPEPTVVTGAATSITPTSALIPLSWESEFTVREVGVYYSTTNAQPTLADKSAKGDMASREVVLNGLEPASHYYARGFVTIDTDTGSEVVMGNVVEFTTPEEKKPAIKVSHTLLDFGSIKKGEKAREYFTISNIGSADLTVKLTKASDAFSIDWTSATITPGAEKKVYVTFAPDKVGSFSSAIKIESNAESGNQKVTLRGEATNDVEQVAKIELSKSELSFGEVKVGESNTLSVAVKNTGTADLIVSVSGAPSSVSLSWKEATIVPNSSKSLSVTYTPKEVSELSSVLKFTSNATNGTKTVNLSGKGVSGSDNTAFPVIALSAESLDFGNVTVGESGKKAITISNTGNKVLTVSKISFPSGYTGDWSSGSIASGSSKVLNLTFRPTAAQTYNGNLTIESDASNGSSKVVSIKGTGVAKPEPKLSVSTNLVDFGDQIKFTQETKSFTIKNSGTGTLVISSIKKTSNYGDLFSISGWTSGGSIAAGASKTITVSFQPLEERTYEETVTIVSSNAVGTKTQTVTLRGTGVPEPENAIIKFDNSSLAFGSVEEGESVSKSFTVTNSGTTILNISSIKVVASDNTVNPDYYTVSPTGSCTVSPGKSKSFTVTFSPKEKRDYNALISIKSNASNATQGTSTVSLSGTGIAATSKVLSASPSSLSFGMQSVGNRTSKNFTVKNNGTKAVTLYSIEASDGFELGSTWTEGSNYGMGPSSSKTFSIAFAPKEARAYNGSIVIKSNASNGDLVIPLSGTGEGGSSSTAEYVDLGLSVKWATCNLGATKPEEYGNYYAWGETEPKSEYSWSTYKWGNDEHDITKYCTKAYYGRDGFTDNKTVLDLEDDAAHVALGGSWRMPTKAEQEELLERCTWEWTTMNGVGGQKVTGPNGNSIFLPAAGHRRYSDLYYTGSDGCYWSSSLSPGSPECACYVLFNDYRFVWNPDSRYCGRSVRPVTE